MRITEIKNDLLSIGIFIVDREFTLIALGGLHCEFHVFNTTILNNDRIPGFEELLTRCSQEETRMMEMDMPSNRNDPTAFSAHAKKKNNPGSKKQCQRRLGFKNGREDASSATSLATMLGSVLIEGIHLMMMTTTATTISGATTIKGMVGSTTKEKGILPLLNMEMVALSKDQEIPSLMNLKLLITSKKNFILYLPSLLPLLRTPWEIG